MALNLGMLGYFKYFNFFAESLHAVAGPRGAVTCRSGTSRSSLPIGISFYTFQSMSYVIDVYRTRDQADAEPDPVRGVRLVLPAPGRRADHAADHAAAAGRPAATSSTSSSSTRGRT